MNNFYLSILTYLPQNPMPGSRCVEDLNRFPKTGNNLPDLVWYHVCLPENICLHDEYQQLGPTIYLNGFQWEDEGTSEDGCKSLLEPELPQQWVIHPRTPQVESEFLTDQYSAWIFVKVW